VIVLDTHVLVWYAVDDKRLGSRSRRRIREAIANGELSVSAFSYWEIALLVAAGRLRLEGATDSFRAEALQRGIEEVAVDGRIAIIATRLSGMHGDPADRIIVATAIERNATLMTADSKILEMKGGPTRIDAQT
jgi:PIN domain nuclease of toxin-antitoxin system